MGRRSATERVYPPPSIQATVDAKEARGGVQIRQPRKLKRAPASGRDREYLRKVRANKREAKRLQEVYKQREAGFEGVRDGEHPLAIDDAPIRCSGANSLQPINCLLKGSWDRPGINRDRKYRYDGPLLSP